MEKNLDLMWTMIESFNMTKSLDHRLCMKQQLYSFNMVENKSIIERLKSFHKIFDDMENIMVNIKDEGDVLLLLNSLPISLSTSRMLFFKVMKVLLL